MKKIILLIMVIVSFSCNKQEEIIPFPVEKLFIVEWGEYEPPPYISEDSLVFDIVECCDLGPNFILRKHLVSSRVRGSWIDSNSDKPEYSMSETLIPDCLMNRISQIILNNLRDTAYLPAKTEDNLSNKKKERELYFIIKKTDEQFVTIRFVPEALPGDLLYLFRVLYENKQTLVEKEVVYNNLFKEFNQKLP